MHISEIGLISESHIDQTQFPPFNIKMSRRANLGEVGAGFEDLEARVRRLETRLVEGLENLGQRLDARLESRLRQLESRLESRLRQLEARLGVPTGLPQDRTFSIQPP